jgi:hypothetical protein
MIHLTIAATNLFSIGGSLVTRLGGLLGTVLILFIGAKALHHVAQDRFGLALGVALIALIPAAFLFDPTGMTSALKSAVQTIGG